MDAIDIQARNGTLVVAPAGDIDMTNAHELRTAILSAVSNEGAGVVVDLSAVNYLDSYGIRVLFSVARRLEERRKRLVIVAPPDAHLHRLLSIVDMDSCAPVRPTVEAARAQLTGER